MLDSCSEIQCKSSHTGISSQRSECESNFQCIPITQCERNANNGMVFPCDVESSLYCCRDDFVRNITVTNQTTMKEEKFPVNCGIITIDNKIIGGEPADPGQFPWMALLGYQRKPAKLISYFCGGSLVSDNYVLTAAHCLKIEADLELVHVRLGENNLQTEEDCPTIMGTKKCSNKTIDAPVQFHLAHPLFNSTTLKNDIAIVKLKARVSFTDFIQPICLPFGENFKNKEVTGQKLIVSGWGKIDPKKISGSTILQYATVTVWEQLKCESVMPPEVRPLNKSQICANGKKEDSCKGDSGGPLFNIMPEKDSEDIRAFQIGIVSFAPVDTCGVQELPSVYTRVDEYLDWVTENVK